MFWMSLSWSELLCQDDGGGGASPELPEVEDTDAVGEAAMAMAAKLRRGEEMARKMKAESSENSPSRHGGGEFWSAREQGGCSVLPPLFKCRRLLNG